MGDCAENRNPLQLMGTSQQQRYLPGMSPSFVRTDEREFSDWIMFAAEFSRYLRFYDAVTGGENGNWSTFFTSDISALLGTFAVQSPENWRTRISELLNFVRDNDNAGNPYLLKENLSRLFSCVFTFCVSLDMFYQKLPESGFRSVAENIILSRLAPSLKKLISYYKAAQTLNLYQSIATDPSWKILSRNLEDTAVLLSGTSFSPVWSTDPALITEDLSVYGNPGDVYGMISRAARHFLFTSVFDQFTGAFARLTAEAEKGLLESMENGGHSPDYTLFLTFVKLFRNAQNQLNQLTWKHLDLYYRDILRLKPKGQLPDKVHLIATLSSIAQTGVLKKGTLFKAGTDSQRKEVFYELERETTFNKAAAASFKSVYRGDLSGKDKTWNTGRYFAAPAINSADGEGAELKTALNDWHPFAIRKKGVTGETEDILMPPARIGFAVASHYMFLAEGKRTIRIRLNLSGGSLSASHLACYLTTEKKWLQITPTHVSNASFSDGSACREILFSIPPTEPAISAYNPEIHGGNYGTDVPVLRCELKNETVGGAYPYEQLKSLSFSKLELVAEAGTTSSYHDGLKQLTVSNQNGNIDTSKPFQPWGAIPEKDHVLIIGSRELFSKKNTFFNIGVEWANRPGTVNPSPSAKLQYLAGGTWQDLSPSFTISNLCDLTLKHLFGNSPKKIDDTALVNYKDAYQSFNQTSQSGFLRLVLNGDFGHEAYVTSNTLYLIAKARGETASAPSKPYTPTLQSLNISYSSHTGVVDLQSDTADFAARPVSFFHSAPFGEAEQHFLLNNKSSQRLLPQFQSVNSQGETIENAAEFYIGLKNISKEQTVNMLFQLMEGSTDPLTGKPQEHIRWSYLSGNLWLPFPKQMISDNTRQLIQSGIISFTFPDNVTDKNTIMPTGHVWIKAGVEMATDAVARLIAVHTQAMQLVFKPDGNAEDFLDTPLKPGTITKLKTPDVAFKSFLQPYSSFEGRPAENNDRFYLRTSERVRHKGRAVTIWDYERLVLEAFPQLYKVKCLNHTKIIEQTETSSAEYNEKSPGHVALITIPYLRNRNETNPLKPYTSLNLLEEVKVFLLSRISGQVKLHVCNPVFEEVMFSFKLQLMPEYSDFTWYSNLLKEEITKFLSPWAFSKQGEILFGGRICKSTIINFIDERHYVDFITEVKMYHRPADGVWSGDLEEAEATTLRSILVSAPSASHLISKYIKQAEVQEVECDYLNPQQNEKP